MSYMRFYLIVLLFDNSSDECADVEMCEWMTNVLSTLIVLLRHIMQFDDIIIIL